MWLPRLLRHRPRAPADHAIPDAPRADLEIAQRVAPYTMTSLERRLALIDAVRYVVKRQVPGAFVECGVWKGGSMLAMALTLLQLGRRDRDLWLYDTFSGMTEPSVRDVSRYSPPALSIWNEAQAAARKAWGQLFDPAVFGLDQVRGLLESTGYPEEQLHFVEGPVEQTLPRHIPGQVALLRLDTDWYESTRHELVHLYPRLAPGGVLIVDDYGHWEGCRQAVDEYFAMPGVAPVLLTRIDYTGRLAVKP